MSSRRNFLDDTDYKILNILQRNSRTPLEDIEKKIGIAKSTVNYRIKRLEKEGIIKGYRANVDLFDFTNDFQAILLIRAKYGLKYTEKVSKLLLEIPGVWAAYNVLGEWDFIVLLRAGSREKFVDTIEEHVENIQMIERTNTNVIARIIKEDEKYIID